ncbi:hypothetical protein TWF481_003819 [Arthrobotrys musiformis]|uniref:F-box domain-containing protein n=1 Tax=Arthrobotrys musiformis TaxID=47236 RepID=A0AAV9WHP1_9PEZI
MSVNLLDLPAEIILKILSKLDYVGHQQGLERPYSYPKATALGRAGIREHPDKKSPCRYDAVSRCNKKLRILCFPFLFRCLTVNISEEQTAIRMLQFYLSSGWILQYTRKLYFIMDIRAIIVAELPMSVMRPELGVLMRMIVKLFQWVGNVQELHFIVRSEIVSNGLRRIFRWSRQQIEASLSNVRSLKFSAGSEWIIRFCGGYSGLHEIENSPGITGPKFDPYPIPIDFAREKSQGQAPIESLSPRTVLSRIGDYRVANIMKGITSLRRGAEMLTKVTIYGKFTQDGLDVFIKCIPVVSDLTIIGGPIEPIALIANHAHILGQLPFLRRLNLEGDLKVLREHIKACPVDGLTLCYFARCIRSLREMWVWARFVGEIFRDVRGDVLLEHTAWKDTWAGIVSFPPSARPNTNSGDVEMGGN